MIPILGKRAAIKGCFFCALGASVIKEKRLTNHILTYILYIYVIYTKGEHMKKEKADVMIDQLKKIITYHNNWIMNQKILKTSSDNFDKAVQDLCRMINEEVKE